MENHLNYLYIIKNILIKELKINFIKTRLIKVNYFSDLKK